MEAVPVPGGMGETGTRRPLFPEDGESPPRVAPVRPFLLDATAVTAARFARFVAATGHVTEAERYGWSFVFHLQVPGVPARAVQGLEWWRRIDGADWAHPEGPESSIEGRADHPVVHVGWTDAAAFAAWAGGRLPSEAEWEHAARGGLADPRYPWGDEEPGDHGPFRCNIWQGRFPVQNSGADGWLWTAPALSFPPNGYGLYNMVGNTWEWVQDPYRIRSLRREARILNAQARVQGRRVMKGGSFLCHASYCHRYRIAARQGNPPDTTTSHISFRVAYDPGPVSGLRPGGSAEAGRFPPGSDRQPSPRPS